jgi:hypothetical protein
MQYLRDSCGLASVMAADVERLAGDLRHVIAETLSSVLKLSVGYAEKITIL